MVDAANNLLITNKTLEKQIEEMNQSLLQYEAKELLNMSVDGIVAVTFVNRSIQDLQKLARFVVEESPSFVCIFVSHNNEKLQVVLAKGKEREESMKAWLHEILPLINGKGGGNDSLAQGGGDVLISQTELLNKAITYIR